MSSAYDKLEAYLKPVKTEKPLQASLEDLTTFTFLIPLGAIYMNNREAFNDLDKLPTINTGPAAVPKSPFTQLLVLISFILCVLRIVAHRFYDSHPWLDLIFSLAVWGIFLTVWILSNSTIDKINALKQGGNPPPTSGVAFEQNKIISSAAASIGRERDWAILGFVLSSCYTAYCVFTLKDEMQGVATSSERKEAEAAAAQATPNQ
jgi:hypothetical protein